LTYFHYRLQIHGMIKKIGGYIMNNKVIESNILYRAREHVVNNGKSSLLNPSIQMALIAVTYNEFLDYEKETYTKNQMHMFQENDSEMKDIIIRNMSELPPDMYTKSLADNMAYFATNIDKIYPKYQHLFQGTYDKFGKKIYDDYLSDDEKKITLKNTLILFQEELNAIKRDDEYNEYPEYENSIHQLIDEYEAFNKKREKYNFGKLKKDDCLRKCYDDYLFDKKEFEECKKYLTEKSTTKLKHQLMSYVIESLEQKLEDNESIDAILESMTAIDVNFVASHNGKTFYPIMFDILTDVATVEFNSFLDKDIIQKNIGSVWEKTKNAQERRGFYTQNSFYRLEYLNSTGYRNIRSQILYEYTNALQADPQKVQKLFGNILYDSANSKKSPAIKNQWSDKIKTRRFFMENTKMVLGQI